MKRKPSQDCAVVHMAGLVITIEGPQGSGKTQLKIFLETLAEVKLLRKQNLNLCHDMIAKALRDSGLTP